MRYVALIYGTEESRASMSEAEQMNEVNEYNAFSQTMGARGVLAGGDALHPASSATTVQLRDGKVLTTDGPFAETKEQLGGFYILNAKDLDEAIEIAAQIPGAKIGKIEIRPAVMDWD